MKTYAAALTVMLSGLPLAGCAAQARSPEPLPLDRVECARCRMLISSESGAGEIVSAHEDTQFFDDIGCLASAWPARRADAVAFVRVGGGWSDVRSAWFAQPAAARTAMGSGFAAFANAADAKAADNAGRAFSWDEVVQGAGGRR